MLWLALLGIYQAASFAIVLRPGVAASRRRLAAVMALCIPVVGILLAELVRGTIGRGSLLREDQLSKDRRARNAAEIRRVGALPPLLERLVSDLPAERLAALVALANQGDAPAVKLLRWAVEHGLPEIVLDAALTLEELDLRREQRLEAAALRLADARSYSRAMACAEAAASGVHNMLADAISIPALVLQARDCYQLAALLEPQRWLDLGERLARLELAAGQPMAALDRLLDLVEAADGATSFRLCPLLADVAFAARRFDLLALPAPPASGGGSETAVRVARHPLRTLIFRQLDSPPRASP